MQPYLAENNPKSATKCSQIGELAVMRPQPENKNGFDVKKDKSDNKLT